MRTRSTIGLFACLSVLGVVGCDAPAADEAGASSTEVTAAASGAGLVLFVYDQGLQGIVRLEDLNGDGDANDPGESAIFFDATVPVTGVGNSIGLLALGPRTLLATDNASPANIVRLDDRDASGDAFGEGEHAVWFGGALPNGHRLAFPSRLDRAADGAIYFLEKNTLNTENPEAIYRGVDANGDGDVDDPGEVVEVARIAPPGAITSSAWDFALDPRGNIFVVDTYEKPEVGRYRSVDWFAPGQPDRRRVYDNRTLFWTTEATERLVIGATAGLAFDPRTGAIVHTALDLGWKSHIVAFKPAQPGTVHASDFRVLWDEAIADGPERTATPRDMRLLADGSIVFLDNVAKQVVRLVDANGDGDFNDAGEYRVVFDAAAAAAAGGPRLTRLLSVAVAPLP